MTPLRLLVAAALVAACAPLTAASADSPPQGQPCDFDAFLPSGDGADWVAVLRGGPVTADSAAVQVTCGIVVDGDRHDGTVAASASSPVTPRAAVLPPTVVTFSTPATSYFTVCASARVGTTTWYWSEDAWTTNAASYCGRGLWLPRETLPPETHPVAGWLDCVLFGWGLVECSPPDLSQVWEHVDPVVCEYLRAARPGTAPVEIRDDGDVYVAGEFVYDCPPYEFR